MTQELKNFIIQKINDVKERNIDERIVEFKDTHTKYIVPKSSVIVEVALKEGLIVKIDVTDYFKEVL